METKITFCNIEVVGYLLHWQCFFGGLQGIVLSVSSDIPFVSGADVFLVCGGLTWESMVSLLQIEGRNGTLQESGSWYLPPCTYVSQGFYGSQSA
jgi:hypothetical protein